MPSEILTLEGCQVIPGPQLTFLDDAYINAEFRNNSGAPITIEDVICRFQTMEGLAPYEAHALKKVTIGPLSIARVQVQFNVELSLVPSNTFSFTILYKQVGAEAQTRLEISPPPFQGSLLIYPSRQSTRYFFISHKISEDTTLATKLDNYLHKIGFKGFLAENEFSPGLDIWKDKIIPALQSDECLGLISLWTKSAGENSGPMLRELRFALTHGIRPMLILQDGIDLPGGFPADIEYHTTSLGKEIADIDLIRLVRAINQAYLKGELRGRVGR